MPENPSPTPPPDILDAAAFDALRATGAKITRRKNIALHKGGSVDLIWTGDIFAVVRDVPLDAQRTEEIGKLLKAERERAAALAKQNPAD